MTKWGGNVSLGRLKYWYREEGKRTEKDRVQVTRKDYEKVREWIGVW